MEKAKISGKILLCFMAGVFGALPMQGDGLPAFLLFFGFGIFYFVFCSSVSFRTSFLYGFAFAFGYFLKGIWWVGNALLADGSGEYAWAVPLAVVGLPALLSVFTAMAVSVSHILLGNKGISSFIGFCLSIGVMEWVRGHVFTGFPWNLYGYVWHGVPEIVQVVSVCGSFGLTVITVFWCACPALLVTDKSKTRYVVVGLAVLSFAVCFGYGWVRLAENPASYQPDISLRIVQPNISQVEKWKMDKIPEHFEKLVRLSGVEPQVEGGKESSRKSKTIIIWPETAFPMWVIDNPHLRESLKNMMESFSGSDVYLLSGSIRVEGGDDSPALRYYNDIVMVESGDKPAVEPVYSKSHLVPFGEYIPFQEYVPLETVTKFSGFEKGSGRVVVKKDGMPAFIPLICYELIFPDNLYGRRGERAKLNRAEWIVNVTNDGWYGRTAAPYQHFYNAIFRAVEEGLPVVRSANTGISGVVDPLGRVVAKSEIFTATTLIAPLPERLEGQTIYSRFGDLPFLVFSVFGLIGLVVVRKKQPH